MIKLESANYIGVQDKYIDNKRKNIEHEIKAMLHYITKKYHLDSKVPLEDYVDELYDVFVLECQCNINGIKAIKESAVAIVEAAVPAEEANPSVSS